ncbi:hypothetical protein KSP40_PGU022423 [Platanthera guangdongensis]|uniref:Uncharacterized protein n=1 Tax=Platanthera guangdongensis TaxID=2320717 RepID=A0ABR2MBP9_9ASPA
MELLLITVLFLLSTFHIPSQPPASSPPNYAQEASSWAEKSPHHRKHTPTPPRQPAHYTFRYLSSVYGPIMRLRLGEIHTFIISSSQAAKEIMKTHDLAFASRPSAPPQKSYATVVKT